MTNKCWKLMETTKRPHKKPSNMKFMGGGSRSPPPLNHQRYEKPKTSRGLSRFDFVKKYRYSILYDSIFSTPKTIKASESYCDAMNEDIDNSSLSVNIFLVLYY